MFQLFVLLFKTTTVAILEFLEVDNSCGHWLFLSRMK